MNRTSVLSAMVVAVSLVSSQAVFAAPAFGHTPVVASVAHAKMIKVTLRNDSNAPMKVKVGEADMTLEPGKAQDLKVAAGSTVVTGEASTNRPAGTILATVVPEMSGATIVIR